MEDEKAQLDKRDRDEERSTQRVKEMKQKPVENKPEEQAREVDQ